MNYHQLIKDAKNQGFWNEETMWKSVDGISELLDEIKESHKDLYWSFMREQYGIMSSGHYDKVWAEYDVSQIAYTGKDGKSHAGAYWTCEQIEEATRGMQFPSGVTKWDKYVAFNAMKSDLCKSFDDEQILKAAYDFYFMDEDWNEVSGRSGSPTKVWEYFCCKNTR